MEQLQRDKVLDKWSYIGEGPKANNYIERIYKSLTAKSNRER